MGTIEWKISREPVDYREAVAFMEARASAIREGSAPETVWLLEHPPLYTAGTSARHEDLLDPRRFPIYATGRGGEYTYHGPGQRIAYLMLDLEQRGRDIRAYVHDLEAWIIATLAAFGVTGEIRDERIGVWVRHSRPPPGGGNNANTPQVTESKIAAIGVRVRKWVTYHGIAINVCPDLSHFAGIVPCGIKDYGVTSLYAQGKEVTIDEVDAVLRETFATTMTIMPI